MRRRPEKRRQSTSVERKARNRERGQAPRPFKDDTHPLDNIDAEIQEVNEKRLSQASTASTIVEAMVIDSSPHQRRQTLRHTGKMVQLDALHNQQHHSNQSSSQPDDQSLKHQLRSAKNADLGLRERFASEKTQSGAYKSALAKLEGSPVVVIPDRRSSLQSSADSTKRLSRTFSLNSKQQSSRPTTAPEARAQDCFCGDSASNPTEDGEEAWKGALAARSSRILASCGSDKRGAFKHYIRDLRRNGHSLYPTNAY